MLRQPLQEVSGLIEVTDKNKELIQSSEEIYRLRVAVN